MVAVRIPLLFVVLLLTVLSLSQSLPAPKDNQTINANENQPLNRNKRAIGVLGIMGLLLSTGSAIQGGICTFTSICGSDPLPEMLDDLQTELNEIEDSLSTLQSDVADIWQETKRSWYFDQIEYATHLRKEVLKIPRQANPQQNSFQSLKLQRFIDEVLGDNGNDKNVLEALYNIPRLVTEERLIEQYLSSQKRKYPDNKREAIRQTWKLIKNIFNVQTDGYVSVLTAYALKYRSEDNTKRSLKKQIARCTVNENRYKRYVDRYTGKKACLKFEKVLGKFKKHAVRKPACDKHEKMLNDMNENDQAYMRAVSELCALWKSTDENYQSKCSAIQVEQPYLKDRRQPQRDHILTIIELFQYPGLQVEVDCRTDNTEGLAFAAIGDHSNEFWGYDKEEGQVRKINRETKHVTNYPLGDICTSSENSPCHPTDINVRGSTDEDFRIAVSTRERDLLLFKLGQTDGELLLQCRKNYMRGQIQSVVVCGEFFGYMTTRGKIELFNLQDCSNMEQPAKTWALHRRATHNFLRCSNDGTKLLVEPSGIKYPGGNTFFGFAVINLNGPGGDLSTISDVKDQAEVVVENDELPWQADDNKRLDRLAGLGYDNKGNFFMSAGPDAFENDGTTGRSVGGIYQRTSDGTFHVIREYPRDKYVTFHDLVVDEDGFVFAVQQMWKRFGEWKAQCVHKYNPELDFENVNPSWSEDE